MIKMTVICWLGSVLMASAVAAPYQTTTTTKTTKSTKSKKTTATDAESLKHHDEATKNASDAQIATAKAAGLVWVNLSTKVYHDSSSEFYGATKSGKFMNEHDAAAAGYHKAKNEK
jgi:hypothetical protein